MNRLLQIPMDDLWLAYVTGEPYKPTKLRHKVALWLHLDLWAVDEYTGAIWSLRQIGDFVEAEFTGRYDDDTLRDVYGPHGAHK